MAGAERHALGVDPFQLLIAQARARLAEAVPAAARRTPATECSSGPKGLRGATAVAALRDLAAGAG